MCPSRPREWVRAPLYGLAKTAVKNRRPRPGSEFGCRDRAALARLNASRKPCRSVTVSRVAAPLSNQYATSVLSVSSKAITSAGRRSKSEPSSAIVASTASPRARCSKSKYQPGRAGSSPVPRWTRHDGSITSLRRIVWIYAAHSCKGSLTRPPAVTRSRADGCSLGKRLNSTTRPSRRACSRSALR